MSSIFHPVSIGISFLIGSLVVCLGLALASAIGILDANFSYTYELLKRVALIGGASFTVGLFFDVRRLLRDMYLCKYYEIRYLDFIQMKPHEKKEKIISFLSRNG